MARSKARAIEDAFPCTDLGNAHRLVQKFAHVLLHVPVWNRWFTWDARRFANDDRGLVQEMAKEIALQIFAASQDAETEARGRELAKWALRSQEQPRIRRMIALAETDPAVVAVPSEFDADPHLLNTAAGIVDLTSGDLIEHHRDHKMTKIADVRYDPDAEAPLWEAFLERVLPDAAVRAFVKRSVGYSLTGLTVEQVLFLLWGGGANGKSVFLNTIKAALGDYARTAEFGSFLAGHDPQKPRNDLARLVGARFVSAIEVDEGRRLAEALVKTVTGNEPITVRFLYKEAFEAMPTFKVWLAANHRPEIRGNDYAIWRRIRLIPFNVQIPPNEQDPDLSDRLRDELPGVLRWAVDGCLEWQRDGLQPPKAVTAATAAYRQASDPLGEFLDECCDVEPTATVPAGQLYAAYQDWCRANGERPLTGTKFGLRLNDAGFGKLKSGTVNRIGLRLARTVRTVDPLFPKVPHAGAHREVLGNGSKLSKLSRSEPIGGGQADTQADGAQSPDDELELELEAERIRRQEATT